MRHERRSRPAWVLAALIFPCIAAAAASTATCAACHGAAGMGDKARDVPALAGQSPRYLFWQLMDFKRGSRKSPVMQPIARGLTKDEMTRLAHDYAKLPVPVAGVPAQPPAGLGMELALHGASRGTMPSVPACDFCHGLRGAGAGPFPRLAGQPAGYLAAQLTAWPANGRPPGPLGLMKQVADGLSEAEIQAISRYYAALPARAAADKKPGPS